MIEAQPNHIIEISELLPRVQTYMDNNFRLVQIGVTQVENGWEVNYSFDKNYAFENLRICLANLEGSLPSISGIYLAAFIYENEIHDLFGLKITNIAIDFQGKFYTTAIKSPFGVTSCPNEQ